MKSLNRTLSLVLVLVMVLGLFGVAGAAYKDTTSVTYKEAVDVMSAIGVFDGIDGSFVPQGNLTREQAAKILCYLTLGKTAADQLTTTKAPFTDVAANRWSAGSIAYCVQQGIVSGMGDGTFAPTANVTGYQFAKMLLVALGYDAVIEGFTGADWAINVAKRSFANDLFVGNDDFNGNTAANREEAALYALNLIQAINVTYQTKGTTITLPGGGTINTGASAPSQDPANKTFMGIYYPSLKLLSGVDAQGRTANVWTFKGVEIGRYAAGADYTFTAKASGTGNAAKIASMGLTGFTIADASTTGVIPVVNNVNDTAVKTLVDLANLTGNGRLVEVTVNPNKVTEITAITVVDFYLAQITAINTTAKTATVKTVNGVSIVTNNDTNTKVYTALSGMKVKDYVLISGTGLTLSSSSTITSVKLPTTATGTVTKLAGVNPDVTAVTVGGTDYSLSKNQKDVNILTSGVMTAKSNVTLYLDSYGYAIYVTDAVASAQYMAVVKVTQTVTGGVLTTNAIGYTPAGTPVSLNLGALVSNALPTVGTLYKYTPATAAAPTGADYEISAVPMAKNGVAIGEGQFVKVNPGAGGGTAVGDTTLTGLQLDSAGTGVEAASAIPYASDVKFIYADKATSTVTVKNGVQTIVGTATLANQVTAVGLITLDSANRPFISAVYVLGTPADVTGTSVLFLTEADGSEYIGSIAYNRYNALIDGAEVSILTRANNSANIGKFCNYAKDEATGAYALSAATETTGVAVALKTGLNLSAPSIAGTDSYLINNGTRDLNASGAVVINQTTEAIGTVADINALLATKTVTVALIYNDLSTTAGYNTVSYIIVTDVVAIVRTITPATITSEAGYTVATSKASGITGETYTVTVSVTAAGATKSIAISGLGTGATVTPAGPLTHTTGTAGTYVFTVTIGTANSVPAITLT